MDTLRSNSIEALYQESGLSDHFKVLLRNPFPGYFGEFNFRNIKPNMARYSKIQVFTAWYALQPTCDLDIVVAELPSARKSNRVSLQDHRKFHLNACNAEPKASLRFGIDVLLAYAHLRGLDVTIQLRYGHRARQVGASRDQDVKVRIAT